MQNTKKAKKYQILKAIRKLQKFWRFYYRMKMKIICNKISSWYKQRRMQKSSHRRRIQYLKREQAAKKIQRFVRVRQRRKHEQGKSKKKYVMS